MKKDELFRGESVKRGSFKFNRDVADVFDDMLFRSIPMYEEGLSQCCDVISRLLPKVRKPIGINKSDKATKNSLDQKINSPTIIYDLGCSTGYFLKKLAIQLLLNKEFKDYDFHFLGVDKSSAMIEKTKSRCYSFIDRGKMSLLKKDLGKLKLKEKQNSAVVSNYTLQFLPELDKVTVLQEIYKGLAPSGIFILSEKIRVKDKKLDDLFIELYYEYKRKNGYSQAEIEAKSQALEDILIPQTVEVHMKQLKKVGFKRIEILNKWSNFVTFLAIK